MDVLTAIRQRRSIRKFRNIPVEPQLLTDLVDLARLHTSAANRQSIRYAIIAGEKRDAVFSCLRWAAYLPDFQILPEERPAAYILILTDTPAGKFNSFEAGAAATTLMVAAQEFGLSTCCLGIADHVMLRQLLQLPESKEVIVAIAIGYGSLGSQIVPYQGNIRYYTDKKGDFLVPKLGVNDLVIYSDLDV